MIDFVGFEGAVGIIIEQRRARRMDVDDGLATVCFLLHASQNCLHAGQVVGGGGVEDDAVLRYVLGDESGIVEVADDCFGAGLLGRLRVLDGGRDRTPCSLLPRGGRGWSSRSGRGPR